MASEQESAIVAFKREYINRYENLIKLQKPELHSNPRLLKHDVEKYAQLFTAQKAGYLEQENKERFLRAILSDPPFFVEQWDMKDIEEKTKAKKVELSQLKAEVAELQKTVENQAREAGTAVSTIEKLTEKRSERKTQVETLEEQYKKLMEEQRELLNEIEDDKRENLEEVDEELLLPISDLQQLKVFYDSQMQEVQETLDQVNSKIIPEKKLAKQQLESDLERLQAIQTNLQNDIEHVKSIHNGPSGEEQRALTSMSNYYSDLAKVLTRTLGLSDYSIGASEDSEGNTRQILSFTYNDLSYEITLNMDSDVVGARVIDVKRGRVKVMDSIVNKVKRTYPKGQRLGWLVALIASES